MEITYNLIKPIIKEETIANGTLHCRFQAPGSIEIVDASINVYGFQSSKSRVLNVAKEEARYTFTNLISRFFQQLLGFQVGISAARIAEASVRPAAIDVQLVKGDKEAAVVEAFRSVESNFQFDEGKWSYKKS